MGGYYGGGYSGPSEVRYLFIDGGAFRAIMQRFVTSVFPEADLPPINYEAVGAGFTKVFYFDCPPPRANADSDEVYEGKLKAYDAEMRRMKRLRGWHVYEGVVKKTGKKATQKEVDVLIAVEMLTHTYRRNMHQLAFITGDQDFRPLLEAVVREGMFVELRYDPVSTSPELIDAADARQAFDPFVLHAYLSREFQAAHAMPQRCRTPEAQPTGGTLKEPGQTSTGLPANLYGLHGNFVLVVADTDDPNYPFTHYTHPDRDHLLRTLAHMGHQIELSS